MRTGDQILETAAEVCRGRTYAAGRSDAATIDCSRLLWEVLRAVYPQAGLRQPEVVIADAARPWSSIDHLRGRVGEEVEVLEPGHWHACQGWAGEPGQSDGHAWLWWCAPTPLVRADRIWEATPVRRAWYRAEDWQSYTARYALVRTVRLD